MSDILVSELLIQFRKEASAESRWAIVEELGCTWLEEIAPQRIAVVRCPPGADLDALMGRFRQYRQVEAVEPNNGVDLYEGGG